MFTFLLFIFFYFFALTLLVIQPVCCQSFAHFFQRLSRIEAGLSFFFLHFCLFIYLFSFLPSFDLYILYYGAPLLTGPFFFFISFIFLSWNILFCLDDFISFIFFCLVILFFFLDLVPEERKKLRSAVFLFHFILRPRHSSPCLHRVGRPIPYFLVQKADIPLSAEAETSKTFSWSA